MNLDEFSWMIQQIHATSWIMSLENIAVRLSASRKRHCNEKSHVTDHGGRGGGVLGRIKYKLCRVLIPPPVSRSMLYTIPIYCLCNPGVS